MGVFYICPAAGGQAVCSLKQMQASSIPGRIPLAAQVLITMELGQPWGPPSCAVIPIFERWWRNDQKAKAVL